MDSRSSCVGSDGRCTKTASAVVVEEDGGTEKGRNPASRTDANNATLASTAFHGEGEGEDEGEGTRRNR